MLILADRSKNIVFLNERKLSAPAGRLRLQGDLRGSFAAGGRVAALDSSRLFRPQAGQGAEEKGKTVGSDHFYC
jgi:hypothetical protein